MSKVPDVDHRSKWILAALELVYPGLVGIQQGRGSFTVNESVGDGDCVRRFTENEIGSCHGGS